MRRRVIIPCYHFFLFLPHDRNLIRYRINKLYPSAVTGGPVTACRCPLKGTLVFSPKPGQQCLSEAIFHLCLHIPLSLGTFRSQTAYSLCLLQEKVLRGFPCSVVYTCTLFFHEFSIWENRITFRKICKRGISRCNSRFLQTVTTSSAACTSTARPFETQWSLTSYPPPYWPQKVLYKSHPSGNLPSLSSTSSSWYGKVQLPGSAEL